MEILSYLASVTIRSLFLAAAAILGLWLFQIKTAAARHAVLTVLVSGMLLMMASMPLLPPIPLRVLPEVAPVPILTPLFAARETSHPVKPDLEAPPLFAFKSLPHLNWPRIAVLVYIAGTLVFLLRLAVGYVFTLRLVRASRKVGEVYESDWIVAPMTVGCLNPKILLPSGWTEWEPRKLEAVLAHERAHIHRSDWWVAAMGALNRCMYWFNPLSWWLERRLAFLAEEACDDAALLVIGTRQQYAQVLWDLADTVRIARGRLNWQVMPMTRPSALRQRIERILDETRQIPRGLTPSRWAALAACSLSAVYLASVLQLASFQAPQKWQAPLKRQHTDFRTAKLNPEEVRQLEQAVTENPEDLTARSKLITHYLVTGRNAERAKHVLWVIEHHPEADVLQIPTLFNEPGPLQDAEAFLRAAALWRQQAVLHAGDQKVVLNAAYFFAFPSDDIYESEQWAKRARDIEPGRKFWRERLAWFYAGAILDEAGWQGLPAAWRKPGFAEHARAELENSTDGFLVWQAGQTLQLPQDTAQGNTVLAAQVEYGKELQKRAKEQLGYQSPEWLVHEAEADATMPVDADPTPLKRVDPVYPPLAIQARIQGSVRLKILISPEGKVGQVYTISGHPLLVGAAQEAVKQWVYSPQTMSTLIEVDVPFQLPRTDKEEAPGEHSAL